ncbi:ABC transporter permease [Herbinix hemicellulosilytica]|nr:FtsX-like permease family protein [Herbinix hemicellulosilytica]
MRRIKAWHKNNFREIKHTLERYLAIMAIIALGVGFFSGLKITKRAMVKTLDIYAANYKMYDFKLLSTLGFTKDDEEYFAKMEGLKAEGAVSLDFIAETDIGKEVVLKAHSITEDINLLNLKAGRMPQFADECILDGRYFSEDVIGTKIRVSMANDTDIVESFANKEYTVVGLADSVNYLNYDRGITDLAGGTVYGFVYMPKDSFATDYFTEIMVRYNVSHEVYSKEYEEFISEKEEHLKDALEIRGQLRHDDIVAEAKKEVMEAEKEYKDAYDEYLAKKSEAEDELDKALKKLLEVEKELKNQEEKLTDAEKELKEGEKEYEKSLMDYKKAREKYESEKKETLSKLNSALEELDKNRADVVSAIRQIEESGIIDQYNQLKENEAFLEAALLQLPSQDSEEFASLETQLYQVKKALAGIEASGVIAQYKELKANLLKIEDGQKELDKAIEEADRKLKAAELQLNEAKVTLDEAKEQIDKNKADIEKGWEALKEGKTEYEKGYNEYIKNKEEADKSLNEAKEELDKARKEIDDAWKEIEDIPRAKVYVLNRNQNMGYSSFENDSSIVEGIAKVLPVFFFLVAALVCTSTMTRMVDEQRTQIGTLKALGYSDGSIAGKYISYSGSAAVIGCIIGYYLGSKYFPMAIWEAYGILYGFADIEYVFDLKLALISLLVSLLCSVGVTYTSCKAELLQMPAQLIRPKAPKAGKRVILEHIPFIWKKIGFLHKVSIRNILRYKRRFFMTVLGIAGCTSLVVAAMGISDSIKNIVNDQFDYIMTYDYSISFSKSLSKEEQEAFKSEYEDLLSVCIFVSSEELEAADESKTKRVTVVATDDPDITKVVGLQYKGEVKSYPAFGKAAVNDKLAKELGLKPGNKIRVKVKETEYVDVEIEFIFENYLYNYLFMTEETYEALFNKEAVYDTVYAVTDKEDIYSVSASLSKAENVINVSVLNDMRTMVNNMMKSMDYIIWLVIICACALGFVVIYNLNNINITERNREIATIKVLGFYSRETKAYVYRETIILTFIGTMLGLGLGKLLHGFIMQQIKVEAVSFKVQIFASSYLISVLVTFMITLLVNLILMKKIERINMAESLKSVE